MQSSFSTPSNKLPTIPDPNCPAPQDRLYPIHFTDLFKFRQRFSSDSPFLNMDTDGWEISINCLSDELDYLGVVRKRHDTASSTPQDRPEQLIVVEQERCYIRRCFRPGGWLHKHGKLRPHWRDDADRCRLDRTASIIEAALEVPGHCVPFWTTDGFQKSMELAL